MTELSPRGSARRRLRNYLLDARFQLKAVGLMVGVVALVAALLGGLLWHTSSELLDEAQRAVEARSQAAQTSKELGAATPSDELLKRFDDPAFQERLRAESKRIDQRYEGERDAILAQHQALLSRQRSMAWSIVFGLLALVVVVAMGTVVATHRVVGPVFRLKSMMQQVGSGELRAAPNLRKGDELQDLFLEFRRMLARLGESQGVALDTLDRLLARAKVTNAPLDLVEEMEALKASLDGERIDLAAPPQPGGPGKVSGA